MDIHAGVSAQIRSGHDVRFNINEYKHGNMLHVWALKFNAVYMIRMIYASDIDLLIVPRENSEAWVNQWLKDNPNYQLIGQLELEVDKSGHRHERAGVE